MQHQVLLSPPPQQSPAMPIRSRQSRAGVLKWSVSLSGRLIPVANSAHLLWTLCDVPIHLKDHTYYERGRVSARWAKRARQPGGNNKSLCCRDDQVQEAALVDQTDCKSVLTDKLCDVPIHLKVHSYYKRGRVSARRAKRARQPGGNIKSPCCRDDQVLNVNPKLQHSARTASLPQKRKRTSAARPSKPSAKHPEVLNQVPTHPSSTTAGGSPGLNLVPRSRSTIPPADLPVVSNVAPSTIPSTAPLQHGSPLKIHNLPVEEYQQVYHEVADPMLRFACVKNHLSHFNYKSVTKFFHS
ncbi:uncharacterized protein [Pagrus major]|uniref:uncharacterized protein n=1 Tax=Pagrus major TaxID=143350 RepID=UPI003CC8A89A